MKNITEIQKFNHNPLIFEFLNQKKWFITKQTIRKLIEIDQKYENS